MGATLHRSVRASHYRGLSCCGAQAPDAQAQQLWLTGPASPRHAGSSQTRARTRVPCIGRQTPNHCATREALPLISAMPSFPGFPPCACNNSFLLPNVFHFGNTQSTIICLPLPLPALSGYFLSLSRLQLLPSANDSHVWHLKCHLTQTEVIIPFQIRSSCIV